MSWASRFFFFWVGRRAAAFRPDTPEAPDAPAYDIFWPGLAAMEGIDWPGQSEPLDWPGL